MASSSELSVPSILLATDLSGRCDRAFDRACALAASRGAHLYIVTAVESDAETSALAEQQALARIRSDVSEALGDRTLAWTPIIATGRPHEVVIDAASKIGAELIVTGVARNELLGRLDPGKTVNTLIRKGPAPVLVVKRRAIRAYRHILVPTDFSHAAELALVRAALMFPDAQFTLLHGYRVPFAGFLSEETHQDEFKTLAIEEQTNFVARVEAKIGQTGRLISRSSMEGPINWPRNMFEGMLRISW